ncbi:pepsin-like aspartic protease [Alteromonas sp. 009811495]|uniref:pepsin-like aspartic protease n=1 Tax=Alteromonas sp. 009811495 TaxID=3002962 RepID=UPI00237DD92A|nr:pepsin-like aspartic protease [Alteromonas sp. 009811495]WDT87463.1 pepsin-like aspartic protease [Alteromonas sp. 009811495]
MTRSLRIPLTNVYAKGGYCAHVKLGKHQHPVNLVLDTGSSTLVVHNGSYQPEKDTALTPTSYEQDVCYGMGGWYGPVVNTRVSFHGLGLSIHLDDVHVAVTAKEESQSFAQADGILGLAYDGLNTAYDLTSFLQTRDVSPEVTYPYTMSQTDDSVRDYRKWLHQYPRKALVPYFTQLEAQGVVANQFALLTHRSSIFQTNSHCPVRKLQASKANHGLLVLGKPHIHADLYKPPIHTAKVLHDKYYNVNVKAVQIDGQPKRSAPALKENEVKGYCTNGIVDSGASMVMFPPSLYKQLMDDFASHNAQFTEILTPFMTFDGTEKGIDAEKVNLNDWPNIYLYLEGEDSDICLCISPEYYWQIHAPKPELASFKILSTPNWPNQSILGLPLLNNYYTIFDRENGDKGVVQFATKATLSDALHLESCRLFHAHTELNNTKE